MWFYSNMKINFTVCSVTTKGCKHSDQGDLLVITFTWNYLKTKSISPGSCSNSLGIYCPSATCNWPPCKRQYLSMFVFPFCFNTKYNYLAWRTYISVSSVQAWFKEDLWLQPINLLISDAAPAGRAPSNPFLQLCIAMFLHPFMLREEMAMSHISFFLVTSKRRLQTLENIAMTPCYLFSKRTWWAWSYLHSLLLQDRVN